MSNFTYNIVMSKYAGHRRVFEHLKEAIEADQSSGENFTQDFIAAVRELRRQYPLGQGRFSNFIFGAILKYIFKAFARALGFVAQVESDEDRVKLGEEDFILRSSWAFQGNINL